MTKEEIFLGLKDTLVSTFELEEEKVTMEANIVTDLDLDSIDIMDLIAELRRKVKCSFTADDYKQVRTVGDIVDVIYNKLQENS
jgi:acyl carrier protein